MNEKMYFRWGGLMIGAWIVGLMIGSLGYVGATFLLWFLGCGFYFRTIKYG
jgi:hypothetical protein